MNQKVDINKKIYSKNSFSKIVDINFNQLIPQTSSIITETVDESIEGFFQKYNDLFFDIPMSGSDNSHFNLMIRSSEYIGLFINDLVEEIRILREENVNLKNQLFNTSFSDQNISI